MKIISRALAALSALAVSLAAMAATENPQPVADLLNRIGGSGTSARLSTVVDETIAPTGQETFIITSDGSKPCIKGSTLSALTTGIGWYLNHYANINLSWNQRSADLSSVEFPLPATTEQHNSSAEYRYYLNYCTFSYSMSTWTWERWQEEIDWMALHGINMPLQIIGLEEVWRKFLMEDCGYSQAEVNDFVAGPSYMAWFGMNNLEGWGGPNPDWWYERQAKLGKQINERMRSLGIEPVLPGFYQVPSNFAAKTGLATVATGGWCGFSRPHLVSVDDQAKVKEFGAKYYNRLKEVMGTSRFYSMDPFHEGGQGTESYALSLYQTLYDIMNTATPDSKWVIQQWQWNGHQRTSLQGIPKGKLIVLDLNAERAPAYNSFDQHETVFSTIFNFGARTGYDGRFQGTIDGYFNALNSAKANIKGVGAAPEGIEQTPVAYDMLFELPWYSSKPDAAQWMASYAKRRYSAESPEAAEAFELLRTSALNHTGNQQGPHEAIICARPSLTVGKVSTWGFGDIFYDRSAMTKAAYKLLEANLSGPNYSFDLADIIRQAVTDYSKALLAGINEANAQGDSKLFAARRDAFLQLILDLDELLNTNPDFMLGHWTKRARAMADEVSGTTDADRDWLELNNARQIISTWGAERQANGGGLNDYSYREWGGMLKDFYYQRWKVWFDAGMKAPSEGWFQWAWNWAHSNPNTYDETPVGNTREVATRLLPKYLSKFTSRIADQEPIYIDRLLNNDYKKKFFDLTAPESDYTPEINGNGEIAEIAIDFSTNGRYEENEIQTGGVFTLPADAPIGERTARVTFTDGTVVTYTVKILVDVTVPRTVSVATADAAQGSVSIEGSGESSVTTTEPVVMTATAQSLYDFDHWEDADGNNVGNDNPMTYYAKGNAAFTAHFVVNKWGVPAWTGGDKDRSDMATNAQFLTSLSVVQNGESNEIYSASSLPAEHYFAIPTRIKAAPGGEFTFNYTGNKAGLAFLFLSAYADTNIDGEFDMATELLGTIGTRNLQNQAVGAGTFTMLLPYDTKKGTTHIRLRFDSAWGDGYNATYNAFEPKAGTNRLIYELLLEVVDSPEYACTVTYNSNDPTLGTMRSENESMVYNPGETVIITAFPNPGVKVVGWVDNHGRALPSDWIAEDGLSVEFKAFDNATITAIFEPQPLAAGDFLLNWQPTSSGKARITGVAEATGSELDLANTEPAIESIAPEVLESLKSQVTKLTLPNSELYNENVKVLHSANHKGAGTQNANTKVNPTISGTTDWTLTLEGSTDGSTYNAYGSALYGNGTNCLATDYSGGWSQIYLNKAGTVIIKWDSAKENAFSDVTVSGNFTITASYDAKAKQLTATVISGGKSQTLTISNSSDMKDISQYVTAIPKGINFTLTFAEPAKTVAPGQLFSGFHCLTEYAAPAGYTLYNIKNGVVYAKNNAKKVVAYPEGRLHTMPVALTDASGRYFTATPTRRGETLSEAAVLAAADAPILPSLWAISTTDGATTLTHLNSGHNMNAAATLAAQGAPLTYALVYGSSEPSITLAHGSNYLKGDDAGNAQFAAGASAHQHSFQVIESIEADAKSCGVVSFPFAVTIPGENCYALQSVDPAKGASVENLSAGDVIAAATPIIYTDRAAFRLAEASAMADTEGLLRATLTAEQIDEPHYTLSEFNFVKQQSGIVPANSAYILAADLPAGMPDSFSIGLSESNAISTIAGADSGAEIYDLQGRRVSNPRPGLYIVNGVKTILK